MNSEENQQKTISKKRGRPSKEELLKRAKDAEQAEIALKKELLERQKKALENQGLQTVENNKDISSVTNNIKDPNWIPQYPIFITGQRVKQQIGSKQIEGVVIYDSIDSPTVRVKWDDGRCQTAAKANLTRLYKKVYKNVYKQSGRKTE